MRTIFLYIYFFFYTIWTLTLKKKYCALKKQGKEKEAGKFLHIGINNWANKVLDKVGVDVKVEGLENIPEEACCFVANHQGNFDILAILGIIDEPMGFIAKKEMEGFPIVSWWMKQMQCVFMDRKNIREALKAINKGSEILKSGHSMVIFPEGTRSKGHKIGEFKKGSLKIATKSKAPIVPISIDGSYRIFEEHKGWVKKGEIKLVVGKPIYLDELSKEEQKDISEIVKNKIIENL